MNTVLFIENIPALTFLAAVFFAASLIFSQGLFGRATKTA
jgi:hypothetical protein